MAGCLGIVALCQRSGNSARLWLRGADSRSRREFDGPPNGSKYLIFEYLVTARNLGGFSCLEMLDNLGKLALDYARSGEPERACYRDNLTNNPWFDDNPRGIPALGLARTFFVGPVASERVKRAASL